MPLSIDEKARESPDLVLLLQLESYAELSVTI